MAEKLTRHRPLTQCLTMNDSNNIYYLFSTAAQSIAAFIGLLIAGYALVLSMMDAAVRDDETRADVYDELKRQFHQKLKWLATVTAIAIFGCLVVIFLNKYEHMIFPYLAIGVFLLVSASIFGGVLFVITIIDPSKYRTVARQLAREVEAPEIVPGRVSRGDFLESFINIEQLVRRIWGEQTNRERVGSRQGFPSFREMLEVLASRGIIDQTLHAKLMSISRHRNVIVHGEVDFVNPAVSEEAKSALLQLGDIAKSMDQTPGKMVSDLGVSQLVPTTNLSSNLKVPASISGSDAHAEWSTVDHSS
jgi:hypothetical protein